jgi:hypothetical protein
MALGQRQPLKAREDMTSWRSGDRGAGGGVDGVERVARGGGGGAWQGIDLGAAAEEEEKGGSGGSSWHMGQPEGYGLTGGHYARGPAGTDMGNLASVPTMKNLKFEFFSNLY